MDQLKYIDNSINNTLASVLKKPTLIRGVIHLLLILYAARLAPQLPDQVLELFKNSYFKMFIFSLILWTSQFSPSISILIAVSFMITINFINNKPLLEFMDNVPDVAPTKDMAVNAAMASTQPIMVDNVVHLIGQQDSTSIVQPKIVQTSGGQAVINPSVVIAPLVVTSSSGQSMTITPAVTILTPKNAESPMMQMTQPMAPTPMTMTPPMMQMTQPMAPTPMTMTPSMMQMTQPMAMMPTATSDSCYTPPHYDMERVMSYSPDTEDYGAIKF
jgi:hypothetical protein